ncbi:MAG: serine hydrolase [Bacteroidales bacterium]|jgi:CubicO group peptidase (beta-lactamase class C family)|nr:serine hydrolase [Bacteroidales bacterium]MDD4385867.1 serine hydrolase [Bacteroidales bacterium]MDY0198472.1 serine hydrolase [Tenuifilaceae bacterium]
MKRKILISFTLSVIVALTVYLSIPQNHYIVKALIYQKPKIHHNTIFANRTVEIGEPEPWQTDSLFNTYDLAEDQLKAMDKYKTVAFLVARDSLLLFESYWEGYGPDSYSNSFSMAKSIVGLLIGCALDEGFIDNLDQPVADFIPEFAQGDKAKITIRHLLTMSSGLSWDEAYSSLFSTTTQAYYGKFLRKLVLDQTVISEPGKEFNYLSGDTQLLSIVLAKATGQSVADYMSNRIWSRIGAEHSALWSLDREGGIEKAYCCFNSNARDFARIGRLVLNGGEWNGEQIVSKEYLEETLKPTTYLADKELGGIPTERYGNKWWFTTHRNHQVIFARGILGQYIFIIPDLDMVVVRLGHLRDNERIGGQPIDIFAYLDIAMDMSDALQ